MCGICTYQTRLSPLYSALQIAAATPARAFISGAPPIRVMTVPPNVRHQELFVKLQREAREQKRGLWADPSEATTPPSTVTQADRQNGQNPRSHF